MPVSEALAALISKGVSELGTNLIEAYSKRASDLTAEKLTHLKSNITPHIDATFKKCSVIKTLLNPHHPANFLSIYAKQRFSLSQKGFDHYGMVDYIKCEPVNMILTGTGGSGKSMFTRYLWLSLFADSGGKIPLFVELRNVNSMTTDDITIYLQQTISIGQALITEKDFKNHLNRGDFVIIFDGFDEVVQDKKQSVQRQIISLAENYSNLKIVVTSRPDGRFSSWPSFEVSEVAPLEKPDVIELIELSEFSDDSKKLFLKRLKDTNLFEKHNSFLTNPLLASMMLLTFSHNFDIPDRMHLFYEQAFDALYQRHDSYKPGGFTRQFKTNLPEDVFKRIISYFCLITYNNEEFTFSRDKVMVPLQNAINLAGVKADPGALLEDLNLCVCFLIEDGLQYIFSHRSFQEYFAAYCLAFVVPDRIERLVPKFIKRVNDQVVTLLADMNPENFRRNYLIPMATKFKTEIQLEEPFPSVVKFYEFANLRFQLEIFEIEERNKNTGKTSARKVENIAFNGDGEFFEFVTLVDRLYKKAHPTKKRTEQHVKRDYDAVTSILNALDVVETGSVLVQARNGAFNYLTANKRIQPSKGDGVQRTTGLAEVQFSEQNQVVSEGLDEFFKRSYMYEFVMALMNEVIEYLSEQFALETSSAHTMDDLFGVQS